MKMEATAMVIRGWPNDGAVDRAETIKASTTLVNGDWVSKHTDGTVLKAVTATAGMVGLVVSGNGDAASASNANKAVVLWGNYIVSTSNYVAGAWAPGSPVTIKDANPGVPVIGIVGTDPILGYVLDVVAVSATETAHITIMVK